MIGKNIGVIWIMAILPLLYQQTSLSLQYNWFGDAGAKHLADNLMDDTSLMSHSCDLHSVTIMEKQAFLKDMHVNTTM